MSTHPLAMNQVLTHNSDGVLVLTLNRPERKNAMTACMYDAVASALLSASADGSVRTVVIRGSEDAFTAGNDLEEFLRAPPESQDAPPFRFLAAIANFPKPILAAVCGPAIGVGTTMLFHCDLVYAGNNARFAMSFTNLGLCPEAGAGMLAPDMFGYHQAAEALLFGEAFDASAALSLGLVNRVLRPAEVASFTLARAQTLAAKPLTSLVATKRLLKRLRAPLLKAQMHEEAETFIRMLREASAIEAFNAFAEKRSPDFSRI